MMPLTLHVFLAQLAEKDMLLLHLRETVKKDIWRSNMWQLIKSLFCKHKGETVKSSCPFTGITYTYCAKCNQRTHAERTPNA